MISNLKACVHGNNLQSEYDMATTRLWEGVSQLRNGCLFSSEGEKMRESSIEVTCGLEVN